MSEDIESMGDDQLRGYVNELIEKGRCPQLDEPLDACAERFDTLRADVFAEAATNEGRRSKTNCATDYHMLKKLLKRELRPDEPNALYEEIGARLVFPMHIDPGFDPVVSIMGQHRIFPDADWLSRYEQRKPQIAEAFRKHLPSRARKAEKQNTQS